MNEYALALTTDVPAECLWQVAAEVARDPVGWFVAGDGWRRGAVLDTRFPVRLVAHTSRFLARVSISFEFEPVAGGTHVRVEVQLRGPLAFAYRGSFERHHQSLSASIQRFVRRARQASLSRPACGSEQVAWGQGLLAPAV